MAKLLGKRPEGAAGRQPSSPDARRTPADEGLTLMELLIATVLMAIAVVTILGAWLFAIRASDRHRNQADAQAVLASAAEQVLAPTFAPFTDATTKCAVDAPNGNFVPTNYEAIRAAYEQQARLAALPDDPDWTGTPVSLIISVPLVEFWTGGDTGDVWGSECFEYPPPANPDDPFVQPLRVAQVTIRVVSPDGEVTRELQVVKSSV